MPWPAIAIAAAGMLQQMMNSQAASDTNAANLAMNRENNNLQIYLANQKYAKELEQWNRANAYNSPVAQKGRMLEAGLNPALHRIETGQATSSPEMAMPQTTAFRKDAPPPIDLQTPIASAYNAYYQNQRAKAEIDGMLIDNQTRNIKNWSEIERNLDSARGERARAMAQEINNEFLRRHNKFDLQLKENEVQNLISKTELNILEGLKRNDELLFLPQKYQMEVARLGAEIMLTRENINVARAELTRKLLENRHLNLKVSEAEAISKFVVMKAKYQSLPTLDEYTNAQRYNEMISGSRWLNFEAGVGRASKTFSGALGVVRSAFMK